MKYALITATLMLASSSALAADTVYQEPVSPIVEAPIVFTWSGPYVGAQGGAGWMDLTNSTTGSATRADLNGGLVGGFIGFQHQFQNNLVLGIEGDLGYNWNEKKVVDSLGDQLTLGTELDASVRARLGYAADRSLFYVTGGWATTRGYGEATDGVVTFKEKATLNGWTAGAGLEHAFTDNLFGRAEYRYNEYGPKSTEFGKIELDQHTVKIGVGVKF